MDQAEYERRARGLLHPQGALHPNIEDRRTTDLQPFDFGRAFDPTPLAQSINPKPYLHGEFLPQQVPIDPSLDPGAAGRALGTDDLDKALRLNQLMSALGVGQGVG